MAGYLKKGYIGFGAIAYGALDPEDGGIGAPVGKVPVFKVRFVAPEPEFGMDGGGIGMEELAIGHNRHPEKATGKNPAPV
jgi:hypothetical protein